MNDEYSEIIDHANEACNFIRDIEDYLRKLHTKKMEEPTTYNNIKMN